VNRSSTSQRVLVYLEGGGACWDDVTCNLIGIASYVNDDVPASTVLRDAQGLDGYLFARDMAVSPFADATFIYVPYCTGDVHVGDIVQPYRSGDVHHVGHRNVTGVLAAVRAAFPSPERVWVSGASAGGYGAMVAWYRFREAFPGTRVDCLNDSGPPVDIMASRWEAMIGAWSVPMPSGCPECLESLSNVTAYYQRTATDGDRFALLQYTEDNTIRTYTGLSASQMSAAVNGLVPEFAATTSHRIFVLEGSEHVVLGRADRMSGGESAHAWVRAFATDGAGWDNVTP
jgi:hypothetical protein